MSPQANRREESRLDLDLRWRRRYSRAKGGSAKVTWAKKGKKVVVTATVFDVPLTKPNAKP